MDSGKLGSKPSGTSVGLYGMRFNSRLAFRGPSSCGKIGGGIGGGIGVRTRAVKGGSWANTVYGTAEWHLHQLLGVFSLVVDVPDKDVLDHD